MKVKLRIKYLPVFILCFALPAVAGAQDNAVQNNARIDSLLTNVHAQEDDTNRVNSLIDLAYEYHYTSPYTGIKYGNEALELAQQFQWEKGIARANSVLGVNYFALSSFSVAFDHWEKALRICEKIGYKPGIANHLLYIGNIFFSQGNYEKALQFYDSALKKNEELGDKKTLTTNYTALGNVYGALKSYPWALNYHNKALKMDEELHLDNDVAADMMNLGSVYADSGNCSKALEYLFKALEIKKGSGDMNGLAKTFAAIGKTYLYIANDSGGKLTNIDSTRIGKTKNALQAIAYLDSAINIDEEIGFLDNLQRSSKFLSEAQELLGNYKDALASYKRYSVLKDSIYSATNTSKIGDIEKKQELEAKDNELARKKEQHKYFVGGIISMFVIIALLAVVIRFVFKNYAVQKNLNNVITTEKKKSEDLLLNILPPEVAAELKEKGNAEARNFENVTVLFTDFVNFTGLSERLSPKELVDELNVCFSAFDMIMDKYDIEKIKTIGDAYHAVAGLPLATPKHAENVMDAAMEMRAFMYERMQQLGNRTFEVRIGAHSGSVVAGIVGIKKFTYDIWGDTVNTAARMEQNSEAGRINVSQDTYELIKDKYSCVYRGMIEAKNKGGMNMYFVEAKYH